MNEPNQGLKAELLARPSFLVLMIAIFIGVAGMGTVTLFLPVFASDMGAKGIWLGLAFSGFAVSQTMLQPIFGGLSDKLGRRRLIAGGFLVFAVVGILMSFAPNYYVLVLLQVTAGMGMALILPAGMAYAGDAAPKGREGVFMGLFNVALFMGFGMGPLIGGNLKDTLGDKSPFFAETVLAVIAFTIVVLRMKDTVAHHDDVAVEAATLSLSFARMLTLRPVQALATYWAAMSFNAGIAFAFVGVYLTDSLGATAAFVGVVLSTRVLLSGILQVPGGWLADRWNRQLMIGAGMLVAGAATFFIPAMGSLTLIWALFAVLGVSEAISTPAGGAIGVETGRDVGMGTLMGLVATAQSIGLVAGSLAGGLVANASSIEQAFRFGAVIALAGTVLTLVLLSGVKSRARTSVEVASALDVTEA